MVFPGRSGDYITAKGLFSDTHRLENEVKSFLIVHKLKKITVSSLKVELKRGRLIITEVPFEDQRQLKLKCVVS